MQSTGLHIFNDTPHENTGGMLAQVHAYNTQGHATMPGGVTVPLSNAPKNPLFSGAGSVGGSGVMTVSDNRNAQLDNSPGGSIKPVKLSAANTGTVGKILSVFI